MNRPERLTISRITRATTADKDIWLSDSDGIWGSGRLLLRVSHFGTKRFYFRHSTSEGRKTVSLGPYSKNSKVGYLTLEQARLEAQKIGSTLDRARPPRDVQEPSGLESGATVQPDPDIGSTSAASVQATDTAETSLEGCTLLDLCNVYANGLKIRGKRSWKNCLGIVNRHIATSSIAQVPARLVTDEQATKLLRPIVAAGKGRTAAHVKAIMSAAYGQAVGARLDPTAKDDLTQFGIKSNPIARVSSLSMFSRTRERSLNKLELRALWGMIYPQDPANVGIALRFIRVDLLLGGQRCQQLIQVRTDEVDLDRNVIVLFDPKGRREQPRRHELPLTPRAKAEIVWLLNHSRDIGSDCLFPGRTDGSILSSHTVSKTVTQISRSLLTSESIKAFQYSDLRRTTETLMADLRISKEIRAQLLSHGLGGIQAFHYDRHDYMDEKREALVKWNAFLASLDPVHISVPAAAAPRRGRFRNAAPHQ